MIKGRIAKIQMSGVNNDISFNFYQKYSVITPSKKFTDGKWLITDENINFKNKLDNEKIKRLSISAGGLTIRKLSTYYKLNNR